MRLRLLRYVSALAREQHFARADHVLHGLPARDDQGAWRGLADRGCEWTLSRNIAGSSRSRRAAALAAPYQPTLPDWHSRERQIGIWTIAGKPRLPAPSSGAIATPRKPNYDFERRERERSKAAEAAKKAQAKLEKKMSEGGAPDAIPSSTD